MKQQYMLIQQHTKSKDFRWRWLLIAVLSIGVHHVHSLFIEPDISLFRNIAFAFLLVVMPFTLFIANKRIMGSLWILVGVPIFYHAIAGHFAPMIFDNIVPPATESAPGNLIGGAILCIGGFSSLALKIPSMPAQSEPVAFQRLWWIGGFAIIAALATNAIIRLTVDALFTIPSTFTPLTWERFSLFTVVGVVGAVGVFALVGRFAHRPRRTFQWIATGAFLLSFIPNLVLLIDNPIEGTTVPGIVTLMLMHLPPALFSVGLLTKSGFKS